MATKRELNPTIEASLRWPDGWPRTLIEHRQSRTAWKKPITKELIAMKVTAATKAALKGPMATKKKPAPKKAKKAAKKTKSNHHDEKWKTKDPVQIKRKPRAQRLPGMEDSGIQELEALANDMADTISQKKELTAAEKVLNEQLVDAMKKHGKTVYSHRGIHINLSNTEKAKVVIKADTDDTPADPEVAPAARVNSESLAEYAEG